MTNHSNLPGLVGLAVVFLVILAALGNEGVLDPIVQALNSNSGAVIAAASVITALATVVVAAWGWGNWKMYQIEARRREADVYRLTKRLRDLGFQIGRIHTLWVRLRDADEWERPDLYDEAREATLPTLEKLEKAVEEVRQNSDDPEIIVLVDNCVPYITEASLVLRMHPEYDPDNRLASRVLLQALNSLRDKLKNPFQRYKRGELQ